MVEFLDENNLVDQLCVLYTKKRNYLKGYLSYLEQLEQEGKIEIILICKAISSFFSHIYTI